MLAWRRVIRLGVYHHVFFCVGKKRLKTVCGYFGRAVGVEKTLDTRVETSRS